MNVTPQVNKHYGNGVFLRGKPIFKMLLVLWAGTMLFIESWIFPQRNWQTFQIKVLQSCDQSNFEDDPIVWVSNQGCQCEVHSLPSSRFFFRSATLTAYNFAALWPTEICSDSKLLTAYKIGNISKIGFALSK